MTLVIKTHTPEHINSVVVAVIDSAMDRNLIKNLIENYNAGLGTYGTRYYLFEDEEILVNQIPPDLLSPRCLCAEAHNHADNCPIHGALLEAEWYAKNNKDTVLDECLELLNTKGRLEAMKHYYKTKGVTISEAMEVIDKLRDKLLGEAK
jgi:hypothetical protein